MRYVSPLNHVYGGRLCRAPCRGGIAPSSERVRARAGMRAGWSDLNLRRARRSNRGTNADAAKRIRVRRRELREFEIRIARRAVKVGALACAGAK
jgi:hypothetical protein